MKALSRVPLAIIFSAVFGNFLLLNAASFSEPASEQKKVRPELRVKPTAFNQAFAKFSPGMKYLVAYTWSLPESPSFHWIWDAEKGEFIASLMSSEVGKPVFSPDQKMLAYTAKDGTVRLWSFDDCKDIKVLGAGRPQSFSPDSLRLVVASDNVSDVWDVRTGRKLSHCDRGYSCGLYDYFWRPNGQIISSMYDGTCNGVRIVELQTCREKGWPGGYPHDQVMATSFSPDGKFLAITDFTEVKLWNIKTDKDVHTWPGGNLKFSPDGESLAICNDNTIMFVDYKSGKVIKKTERPCEQDGYEFLDSDLLPIPVHLTHYYDGRLEHGGSAGIVISSDPKNEVCLTLVLYPDAWLIHDQDGFFDAHPSAKPYLSWYTEGKTYPADEYWDQFHRPGLLASALKSWGIRP